MNRREILEVHIREQKVKKQSKIASIEAIEVGEVQINFKDNLVVRYSKMLNKLVNSPIKTLNYQVCVEKKRLFTDRTSLCVNRNPPYFQNKLKKLFQLFLFLQPKKVCERINVQRKVGYLFIWVFFQRWQSVISSFLPFCSSHVFVFAHTNTDWCDWRDFA